MADLRRVFPEGERRAFFVAAGEGGKKERGTGEVIGVPGNFAAVSGESLSRGPGDFAAWGRGILPRAGGVAGPEPFGGSGVGEVRALKAVPRRRGERCGRGAAEIFAGDGRGRFGAEVAGRRRKRRSERRRRVAVGGGRHAAGAAVFASRFLSVGGKTFIIFLSMLILLIKSVYCRPGRKPPLYRSALRRTIARSGKFRLPRIGWRKNERFI